MAERIFEDSYYREFPSQEWLLAFLQERGEHAKWYEAEAKELLTMELEPLTNEGIELMRHYDALGKAELYWDTIENARLILRFHGLTIPLRGCAFKSICERAGISGPALQRVHVSVLAEILNRCLKAAPGKALIRIADEKISAVHSGEYEPLAQEELLRSLCEYLAKTILARCSTAAPTITH